MPVSHSQNLLAWALRYIGLGWPVFPLRPRSKYPLIPKEKGGNGCLDASLNETIIRQWWAQEPNANIGLATGHGWWALDIDVKKGGDETWNMLRHQHGRLPDTIEQVTGSGGKQILYLWPDFTVKNSEGEIGPGIDTRGFHGYIVAPPSIHPDTKRAYVWDGLDQIEEQRIAAAPDWLLDLVRRISTKTAMQSAAPVPAKIPKGVQHHTLVSIAGSMRRRGLTAEEIFAALKVINETRCTEPGPVENIRRIADSVARYAPDARYTVFRVPSQEPEPENGASELPLSLADVEAAVKHAIERNELLSALKLAPEIAKLPFAYQVHCKAELKLHFKDSWPTRDFEKLLKEAAADKGPPEPPPIDEQAQAVGGAAGPDLLPFPLTDSGNGERIVLLFGEEIRYCVEMQKWLVWDGRRWAIDDYQVVTQKAKRMARLLYAQSVLVQNDGTRKAVEKHARQSESAAGIAAALKRASTEKTIPISAAELDQHPYLLNCLNGVIDLRSGKRMPHERGYLITKLCHVNYEPQAECKRFLKFLHWAMGDNPEAEMTEKTVRLIAFLQRAFGYSLTSDVSEKAAFIFWGERGNNGKTTLLTTFKDLLAEYSCQISIDTLMSTKMQDAAVRADLADLRGARLVTTSEVEKEHKLSEGKLKYITAGMGKIKSCRKYENPIEFDATHKLFMDANHRPTVRGTDDAIWSRLKCVPFTVRIEKEDPEFDAKLLDKLKAEFPGILAWAVRGCMAWVKEGLGEPPEVQQSNLEWREHDDPLKDFLEDCCEADLSTMGQPDGKYVKASDLAHCYEWWARQNRERFPLGREHFGERLQAKGFRQSRSRRFDGKQARTWEGIQVRAEVLTAMKSDGKFKSTLLED